jgi:hypothetical protein
MTAAAAAAAVTMATSDDAQAGLAVFIVGYVALPLAALVWVGETLFKVWRRTELGVTTLATTEERIVALLIDTLLIGAALVIPLTAMSHAGHEVMAAVIGVSIGTAWLAVPVVLFGGSIGQLALRLRVVDAVKGGPLSLVKAMTRSAIVALEVAVAPTFVLAGAGLCEVIACASNGRSLTDRLLRTYLIANR